MTGRRRTAAIIAALLGLAGCATARAGYLDALLAYESSLWPGKLVRYAEGPATGGAWSTPAVVAASELMRSRRTLAKSGSNGSGNLPQYPSLPAIGLRPAPTVAV